MESKKREKWEKGKKREKWGREKKIFDLPVTGLWEVGAPFDDIARDLSFFTSLNKSTNEINKKNYNFVVEKEKEKEKENEKENEKEKE